MTSTILCRTFLVCTFVALSLAGCDDGSGSAGTSQTATASSETGQAGQRNIAISGQPGQVVSVGNKYSFQPTVTAAAASVSLEYSIANQPKWAAFDAATGTLSGAPLPTDVGTYAEIAITVSDGLARATLDPFNIVVRPAPVASASEAPTISGTPAASVVAGSAYAFTPSAADSQNAKLTFAVQNLPSWAAFNAATGALTGTPTASNVGTFSNIVISVSDSEGSAALTAFSINVSEAASTASSVTLSWVAPADNTNGTSVTNLSGYKIYYGASSSSLNQVVSVTSKVTNYVFSQLAAGQWYFAVAAINSDNVESALSAVAPVQVGS